MSKARSRFKQIKTLEDRLTNRVGSLVSEARSLPAGRERDELLRKAQEYAAAAEFSKWLKLGQGL